MHTILQLVKEPLIPLRERSNTVPEDICRIIDKCLAKDPGDRYQGYKELIGDLKSVKLGRVDGTDAESQGASEAKGKATGSRIFSFLSRRKTDTD